NATPTITLISNSGPVCQGSNVNFSVNTTTAGTASYLWTGVNSFNSNIKNSTILNAQPVNSGTYNVTVTNTFTNGAVCSASATTTLAVVPFGTISLSPITTTLCQGSNLNLSSNITVFPSSYSWLGPSTFTSNIANPSIANILPANAGNYSLTVYIPAQLQRLFVVVPL
ncbi:MAG: immunoglobulin domain-containing protein, partial [Microbacteriaceae bacterium]|nr:immunoglobulin domain-containing protein [Microbacteriaceae bacterium]